MFVHLFSFQRSVHALLLCNKRILFAACLIIIPLFNFSCQRLFVNFLRFCHWPLFYSGDALTASFLLYAYAYMCKALFAQIFENNKRPPFRWPLIHIYLLLNIYSYFLPFPKIMRTNLNILRKMTIKSLYRI